MPTAPSLPPGLSDRESLQAKRTRTLMALARARLANSWLRLAASGIAALVSTALVSTGWPMIWFVGLIGVVVIDRALYDRLLERCETGASPQRLSGLIAWAAFGSGYGNILAALLWFAPYAPGETLAIIYICGGLANAAATLRAHPWLSCAGVGPTVAALLGLPVIDYVFGGAQNSLDLMPLVGGLLLLGFGVNLWKSLVASDVAQAAAEEAVLRERQSAAAAAAAKTDMIQRINDEMRTPMQALIGAAEHLRRAAATPQARAHIASFVQASEVLKLVLDDFSDLDSLENGRLRIEAKPADPRDLARSVASAFRIAAQDKNLELFLDVTPDVPALVELDAARVRQVLFNLLANAVRYTTHGGVRMRLSAQSATDGRVRLNFIVADTGAGMSKAELASIFSRARVSSQGKGPGLGLAISQRLVKLMGGALTARSELGQGTMFSFALEAPVAAARARSAA